MIRRTERKSYKWAGIAAALLLLGAVLVFGLRIKEVTISGSDRYTPEQIETILFSGRWGNNTILAFINDKTKPHKQIPFVEDYKLVFHGPFKVEVIVYDKSIVGYVSYMSSYMYFDKDGIIVESASKKLPGIPWITGLKFGHIVLYQKLPVESDRIFEEILNLTQILSIYGLSVDKIQYNSIGDATLYMGDIEVILGNSAGLNGKIAELGDMLPQLEGKSGTLYLDTYDETKTNPMYTFKPRG